MRMRRIKLASILVVGASASTVWAADTTGNNIALQGSDTLEEVTQAVLAACPGATSNAVTYRGGGSGTGETAMGAGNQFVAPMSRFMNPTAPICALGPTTAEGLVIGLDGLAIVTSSPNATACNGAAKFSGSFNVDTWMTNANGTVTDTGTPFVNCPGCDAGTSTYTLTDWKDVLRLVYTGAIHASADSTTNRDCGQNANLGAVRRSLVAQFGNIFQGGCAAGTCPTGLRHAYRRGDASGTTDVLLASLGAPLAGLASAQVAQTGAKINWFCNAVPLLTQQPPADTNPANLGKSYGGASDYLDGDPIRISCVAGEQTCGPFGPTVAQPGQSGLVLVVEVPTNYHPNVAGDVDPIHNMTHLYPTVACSAGKYQAVAARTVGDIQTFSTCPTGVAPVGGKCVLPYLAGTDGSFPTSYNVATDTTNNGGTFNCIAGGPPFPLPPIFRGQMKDARGFNLFVKDDLGHITKDGFSVPLSPNAFPATSTSLTTRFITGAFARAHMTSIAGSTAANANSCGSATFGRLDSTAQIGCLAQAGSCSIGYAGREADQEGPAGSVTALTVNGLTDNDANIINLLTLGPTNPLTYPISRKLFFNTVVGFGNVPAGSGEDALGRCMATNSLIGPIMSAHGFIPMTATPGASVFCQDFDETTCTPSITPNTNACATLPAGYIQ